MKLVYTLLIAAGVAPALHAATPGSLDVRSRGEISAAIGRADPDYHVHRNGDVAMSAANPAQRMTSRFGPDAVWFDGHWGLAFDGWSCGVHEGASAAHAPRHRLNRVEYPHGALTDWYVNGPFGVQHGVTLERLPDGCDHARLALRYRVLGSLAPVAIDGGFQLGGQRYAGLTSYDAEGRTLPARMRYDADARVLTLEVDASHATAPIVVDPFVESATLVSPDSGAGAGRFGVHVAVSGDTALIGDSSADISGATDRGAVYVFVRGASGWTQQARLLASDGAASDFFGFGLALAGDLAVVGAFGDDAAAGTDQGSAYVYERVGTTWFERQKLVAPDAAPNSVFGFRVAMSGDLIVAGAFQATVGSNPNQGKAYVFFRAGLAPSWSFEQTLVAADGAAQDSFGQHVDVSGDTAIVGAFGDDVGASVDQGSAYVYTRLGGSWTQQQKLVANDGAAGDFFGYSVALDGDTALVGATTDDVGANTDQGSGYVFLRTGTTWALQQKLVVPNAAANEGAGLSVALSGEVAVLSIHRRAQDRGAAAVFRRSGGVWQFLQQVTPAAGVAGVGFASDVALDGTRLIGGAPETAGGGRAYVFDNPTLLTDSAAGDTADPDGTTDDQTGAAVATAVDLMAVGAPEVEGRGVVYLYQLKGTAALTPGCGTNLDSVLIAKLTNVAGSIGDKFGAAVSMSSDGNTIVVGAPLSGGDGRAAVFRRPVGGWSGDLDIGAADTIAPSLVSGDKFGTAVSIADNGTIAVGAPGRDTGGTDAGAVMLFRPVSNVYDDVPEATPVSMAPQAGAAFGTSVSITSDSLIVGAPLEDNLNGASALVPDAGAAYAYNVSPAGASTAQGAIEPSNGGGIGDKFGASVGVSGTRMVVGAPGTDTSAGSDSGAAFVYQDTAGAPTPVATLVPEDGAGQMAGSAVAVAGEYVMLGAPLADGGAMDGEGASYLYEEPEGGWESGPPPQQAALSASLRAKGTGAFMPTNRVTPIKRQPDQAFGSAIGLTRRGLSVGAPLRDDDIPNCASDIVDEGGADAFLFDRVFRNGLE